MKKILSRQAAFFVVLLLAVAVGFVPARISEAAAQIYFIGTEMNIVNGQIEIGGVFVNDGDQGGTVKAAKASVEVSDWEGVRTEVGRVSNIDVYVSAGTESRYVFCFPNSTIPINKDGYFFRAYTELSYR